MTIISTNAGSNILALFLDGQVKLLVDNVSTINQSNQPRVSHLYAIQGGSTLCWYFNQRI